MKTKKLLQRDVKIAMIQENKEKVTLLRTVLGELDRLGKDPDNDLVDDVIRKMWITASELDNVFEIETLRPYLLPRMTDEEIDMSVRSIVTLGAYKNPRDIGKVMKEFENKHKTKPYDKVVVASTARKWLLK